MSATLPSCFWTNQNLNLVSKSVKDLSFEMRQKFAVEALYNPPWMFVVVYGIHFARMKIPNQIRKKITRHYELSLFVMLSTPQEKTILYV
jgi:hypothetical protein